MAANTPRMLGRLALGLVVLAGAAAQASAAMGAGRTDLLEGAPYYRSTFKKRVVLGTAYETDIRFLSAELEPVHVLSVAGLLVDAKGKVVRAGSEGVLSEDTPFWAQALGARKELDTGAVLQLLENERREGLPGRPLTWQVALENLIAQLLGEPSRLIK